MSNELTNVSYDTALGRVQLDADTVKQYLVKGEGNVSDQEVVLFVKMCEAQKLNPFVTGEVYLIKFGEKPAQMVVGYDTYKRRAEENPSFLYKESGIIVCRGQSGEIVQKAGACLYPSEALVGGWCKVHKLKGEREVITYKEVGFAEYDKKNAIWKEKPCTMIEKVAISQCLREAFPKDYEGLYTEEEITATQYSEIEGNGGQAENEDDLLISQEERKALFAKAQGYFGKDEGNEVLKALTAQNGLESTANMTKAVYKIINEQLDELAASQPTEQ